MSLTFRLLGALRVERDGQEMVLSAPKQRVVLASLLLEEGRVVSADRLIDQVWGDDPPGKPRQALQAYVARLRRVLGDALIATVGPGYRLDLGEGWLDLGEFNVLVDEAADAVDVGDRATAVRRLRAAARLWQGEPLVDVPSPELLRSTVPDLQERLFGVVERRLVLELELGRADEVLGELCRMVEKHPLRERLWALLMRALSAVGWRAEALAAYRRIRKQLADELGIDPGRELEELHRELLTDSLRLPCDAGAEPPERATVVVSAPPGMGRAAFADAVQHLLRERIPGGRVMVEMPRGSAERL